MAFNIQYTHNFVRISTKRSYISLSLDGWENLVQCSHKVSEHVRAKTTGTWTVEKDISIGISYWAKDISIHIREWADGRPTSKGIYLKEEDWFDFTHRLREKDESALGKKVMLTLLRKKTNRMMAKESIKDNPKTLAEKALNEIIIKPVDFIKVLANEAAKKKMILERPYECYKRIQLFHIDSMKKTIIDEFEL